MNTNGQSWTTNFRANIDGRIAHVTGNECGWELSIANGSLLLLGSNSNAKIRLDMEDTFKVSDNQWHALGISSTAEGSKIYLDGCQCFSATADLRPSACGETSSFDWAPTTGVELADEAAFDRALTPMEFLAKSVAPEPLIEFAASHLSDYDATQVGQLRSGSIFLRYRVRGPGQHGTLLAAAAGGQEKLNIALTERGVEYRVLGKGNVWRRFVAEGRWDQGHWHDVVLRVGHGAVQIYVDGYMEAHLPGQAFFGSIESCDEVVIGQDIYGSRLFGEVRNAAIYSSVLNDSQIKKLSAVQPLDTQCLFDYGFQDSISYRIPSLLTTKSGVVIAGADQRETIANDSPNSINFVIRRSFDGGKTWGDLQPVLSYPGHGANGASVIDSCVVQDQNTGRIIVLIDHFPGGMGQPNAQAEIGIDTNGNYLLFDGEGNGYTWNADGTVLGEDGELAPYSVSEDGTVTVLQDGKESCGGNVFLKDGDDPAQTLLTARTSFLQMIYSDDDGETWSRPVNLNHQVKKDWMAFLGTAPGNGIQLANSDYAGRLVMPVYYNGESRTNFSATVVYSDDGGKSWKLAKSPNDGRIFDGREIDSRTLDTESAATHEATVIERQDGTVLMLMRNQHPSGKVAAVESADGGETWGEVYFVDQIPEIFCQPNAVAWPTDKHRERVVFANASQLRPYRGRGVLRRSDDGGRTWDVARTFNPAHYVYQCMAVMPDGELGLLWEREMQGLYFTKIPHAWFDAVRA